MQLAIKWLCDSLMDNFYAAFYSVQVSNDAN